MVLLTKIDETKVELKHIKMENTPTLPNIINNKSKIYDNDGAQISR